MSKPERCGQPGVQWPRLDLRLCTRIELHGDCVQRMAGHLSSDVSTRLTNSALLKQVWMKVKRAEGMSSMRAVASCVMN